jgi:HPt (histidine-containing phosphotransfer) domain-containing protein
LMSTEQAIREVSAFEFEELVERCMGNLEFVERVLSKFQQRFGENLEALEQAVEAHDPEGVVRVAHRLKGESANVAAQGLQDRAGEIERLGRIGRVSDIPPCLAQLRAEWSLFAESVASRDPWDGVA